MRYFHINKNKYFNPIVNVDKVGRVQGRGAGQGWGHQGSCGGQPAVCTCCWPLHGGAANTACAPFPPSPRAAVDAGG